MIQMTTLGEFIGQQNIKSHPKSTIFQNTNRTFFSFGLKYKFVQENAD